MGNASVQNNRVIYMDNNSTTFVPPEVKRAMVEWCNMGNPSSGHLAARESKRMLSDFRDYILRLCNSARAAGGCKYRVVFTSGASEANCMAIHSAITIYNGDTVGVGELKGPPPHVVASAIEHKSIIEMLNTYATRGLITVSYVPPTPSGHISAADVQTAIRPNTCLICVMHANNETGALNNIRAISEIAYKNGILFHCDTAQTFGKYPIQLDSVHCDSFCISFHKAHGPPGVGALVISEKQCVPYIYGTQNDGMRGGTENLPGIGASFIAVRATMCDRETKNNALLMMKTYILRALGERFRVQSYVNYMRDGANTTSGIVVLSGTSPKDYLPNTILLSIVKKSGPPICNSQIRADLEARGVIVSIGSACNTASPKASHVLYAMQADEFVRKGALRITLDDINTPHDVEQFVIIFTEVIMQHI